MAPNGTGCSFFFLAWRGKKTQQNIKGSEGAGSTEGAGTLLAQRDM